MFVAMKTAYVSVLFVLTVGVLLLSFVDRTGFSEFVSSARQFVLQHGFLLTCGVAVLVVCRVISSPPDVS